MLGLYATVGRTAFEVENWEQVSRAYRDYNDHRGFGASQAPACLIIDDRGTVQYHCSYNGKIWRGERYVAGAKPVYVPQH
jgi:hypothetical protein